MSLRILIDLNLSVEWIGEFARRGIQSIHWSSIGDPRAADAAIMIFAAANGYVVFTHDLDFGTLLALTNAKSPSVIQVRTKNTLPDVIGTLVVDALRQTERELAVGALVIVEESRNRVRVLPLSDA